MAWVSDGECQHQRALLIAAKKGERDRIGLRKAVLNGAGVSPVAKNVQRALNLPADSADDRDSRGYRYGIFQA